MLSPADELKLAHRQALRELRTRRLSEEYHRRLAYVLLGVAEQSPEAFVVNAREKIARLVDDVLQEDAAALPAAGAPAGARPRARRPGPSAER